MTDTQHSEQSGHETSDANAGMVTKFGIGLVVLSAIVLALVLMMLKSFEKENARATPLSSSWAAQRLPPPGPRLQVQPEKDLAQLHAAEDSVLQSYGWVVREANVLRIPIDRAMELTALRGLPARVEDRESRIEDGGSRP